MEVMDYVVSRIEGDYARLERIDTMNDEDKLVARALLPEEISEGTKLHYECLEYTIIR